MVGVFELFKVGIGPSSSHTVGPMLAALAFVREVEAQDLIDRVERLSVTLLGSLAWTGKGHATDRAVMLGLAGETPAAVAPERAEAILGAITVQGRLPVLGRREIAFDPAQDIVFDVASVPPRHPNTLRFSALGPDGAILAEAGWCSVGGGFVVREDADEGAGLGDGGTSVPHPFRSGAELLDLCARAGLTIADLVLANETATRPRDAVLGHVDHILAVMMDCIDRGLATDGELPGGLRVKRRARAIQNRLVEAQTSNVRHAHDIMDRVSLYAMAVNEENAAGGRVVTAPTNGAAGVIPAVLRYYRDHCDGAAHEGLRRFLLTATAIGALFKMNASISGAEVGCQGEVGVACSMAAAGLCAAFGGTNEQVENAAEIGMEHHLGMTCDPIAGLVQIPCIERNAFGANKAIAAASLALHGDGTHKVSLDHVIATMRRTGADMHAKYKETSQGGLAVNFIEC